MLGLQNGPLSTVYITAFTVCTIFVLLNVYLDGGQIAQSVGLLWPGPQSVISVVENI